MNPIKTNVAVKLTIEPQNSIQNNKPDISEQIEYKGDYIQDKWGHLIPKYVYEHYLATTTDEIDRYTGKGIVHGLSGADPLGSLVVESVALAPVFGAAGRLASRGLQKIVGATGNTTAKNYFAAREISDLSRRLKTPVYKTPEAQVIRQDVVQAPIQEPKLFNEGLAALLNIRDIDNWYATDVVLRRARLQSNLLNSEYYLKPSPNTYVREGVTYVDRFANNVPATGAFSPHEGVVIKRGLPTQEHSSVVFHEKGHAWDFRNGILDEEVVRLNNAYRTQQSSIGAALPLEKMQTNRELRRYLQSQGHSDMGNITDELLLDAMKHIPNKSAYMNEYVYNLENTPKVYDNIRRSLETVGIGTGLIKAAGAE